VPRQLLVTFKDDAPDAMVQAWVLTQRRHADVARVEVMTEVEAGGITRRPSPDGHVDTTVRGDDTFVKAPDGALLERLSPQEKDVVDLLVERGRAGLGPIETQKQLLLALQAFRPERWRTRKVQTATTAYAGARDRLVATGWELVDEPGVYHFRRLAGGA
jgi:hypothetical protein